MKIAVEVTPQMFADLVVTAIEGGIGYWADYVEVFKNGVKVPYADPSSYEGDAWIIKGRLSEDDDGEPFEFTPVDFERNTKGATKHLADWIDGSYDVETADVLFQLAAFGEIVYG